MLLNLPRARDILGREGLAGFIAGRATNYYYLTDYWGAFTTPVGYEGSYFAVLPRRDDAPAGLVLPALEIRRLETKGGTWMPNVVPYSAPDPAADPFPDGTARGVDYRGWPVAPGATLTPLEQRWLGITARLGGRMSADARQALARAVRAAGLEHASVAVDDARIPGWLADAGLAGIRCRVAPELFNETRMVKTPAEIDHLRTAARTNEVALLAAAAALREGATWHELENVYLASMAGQGARGVYLMCGVGELPAGHVRRGEPVMFDALGQFAHYHGDFGRCAVVGEPSAEHHRRHRAICTGWEVAREILRPGLRYSEVSRRVGDAVRAAGIPGFRDPIVHGLGLEHTDDPKPPCVQPQDKPDQVLAADMVINVDLPHIEIGWGSVHTEDTVRITATGCERLGVAGYDLVVRP